jgi:N-acetylornithine carbamoyltransferase
MMNFDTLTTWRDAGLEDLLELAAEMKARDYRSDVAKGKVLGLIFFNPSLRTKVSFETAALHLGAGSTIIHPGSGSWPLETRTGAVMDGNKTEHIREAVGVLSEYCDIIGVRAFATMTDRFDDEGDTLIRRIVEYANVPVINLESANEHPCQGMADWLTLREAFPGGSAGRSFVLSWAPHPNPLPMAVPNSALEVAIRCGMDVTLACPPEYLPGEGRLGYLRSLAEEKGSYFDISHDQEQGFRDADVIYAKSWAAQSLIYDRPDEEASLRRETYRNWTVTEAKMSMTNQARFMHCLPVRRNVVVTDKVLDGDQAIHIQQAGNRLHVQKAILMQLWKLSL